MILRWHASLFSFGVGLHTSLMLRQKSCLMVESPRMEPNHWCLWPTYALWRNTPSMRRQLLAAGAARGFSWVAAVGGHFGTFWILLLIHWQSSYMTCCMFVLVDVGLSWNQSIDPSWELLCHLKISYLNPLGAHLWMNVELCVIVCMIICVYGTVQDPTVLDCTGSVQ